LPPAGSPESATAFLLLAGTKNASADPAAAEGETMQVIEISRSDPSIRTLALAQLARVYMSRKDLEAAERSLLRGGGGHRRAKPQCAERSRNRAGYTRFAVDAPR
jgi:hypothetical protein